MSTTSSKQFGRIHDDYAFFEAHATEAAQDLRTYAAHLHALTTKKRGLIRVLDFGCGAGKFTTKFLPLLRSPREQLQLFLLEPDDVYRQQATEQLQAFTTYPVHAWSALPADLEACFDLVLANHVFYYVPNLDDVLSGLFRALASPGLFLAAIADQRNTLIQFWNNCFALIGKPVPFHTAEDVVVALDHQRVSHRRQDVQYQLGFPDSEENRLKILRFLLGSYFPEVPRQAMVDMFNPYNRSGQIRIQLVHEHLIIWHDGDE